MSADPKKAPTPAAPQKPLVNEAQNEIDQLLNDIEELQQEMAKTDAPELKVIPGGQDAPTQDAPNDDALSEFRADSGSEASLEDLADLKDDSEGSGTSLLDQVIASTDSDDASHEELPEEVTEEVPEEIQEEVHGEVHDEVVEQAAPVEEVAEVVEEEEFTAEEEVTMQNGDSQDGTLTLKLQGQMTLKLQYEYEGQEVTVGFSDGCLKVQLADGTEFKVPVGARPHRAGKLKKVA